MVSDKLFEAVRQVLWWCFFFSQILLLNKITVSALKLVNGLVVPLARKSKNMVPGCLYLPILDKSFKTRNETMVEVVYRDCIAAGCALNRNLLFNLLPPVSNL